MLFFYPSHRTLVILRGCLADQVITHLPCFKLHGPDEGQHLPTPYGVLPDEVKQQDHNLISHLRCVTYILLQRCMYSVVCVELTFRGSRNGHMSNLLAQCSRWLSKVHLDLDPA